MRCVQLRRLHPLGEGQPRGRAIVRHYWAQFLEKHRSDLRGRGLEIGGTWTIRQYGGGGLKGAGALDPIAPRPPKTVAAGLTHAAEGGPATSRRFATPVTMPTPYG